MITNPTCANNKMQINKCSRPQRPKPLPQSSTYTPLKLRRRNSVTSPLPSQAQIDMLPSRGSEARASLTNAARSRTNKAAAEKRAGGKAKIESGDDEDNWSGDDA